MEESLKYSFEAAGEGDLYQYFTSDRSLRSGSGTTLSAFAQLVTLRLNTTRTLISLIDRTHQYILTEATQKSRLLSDAPTNDEDGLLFGRTTLPRELGLCGEALEILEMLAPPEDGPRQKSWSRSPLVINDVTQDEEFKDHPFVTRHPLLRFYAAVPISTKSGFNIGALSVMDDRPREGLSSAETEFLGNVAHAIMAHLELMRSNEGHRRSEKMVKGLGVFMEGGTDLGDWWLELGNIKSSRQHGPKDGAEAENKKRKVYVLDPTPLRQRHISPERAMEAQVPILSTSPDGHSRPSMTIPEQIADCTVEELSGPTVQGDDGISAASRSQSQKSPSQRPPKMVVLTTTASAPGENRGQGAGKFTLDLRDRLVSQSVKEMFSRASNIIQECIEVDGAIFLDANIHTDGGQIESNMPHEEGERHQNSTGDTESSDISTADKDHVPQLSEETSAGRRGVEQKLCGVLGFWTGKISGLHGDRASVVPLAEAFLQTLLRKYPHGHVFRPGDRCQVMSPASGPGRAPGDEAGAEFRYSEKRERHSKEVAEHREAKLILRMLPGARSVAFVPLWDSHRERWFAGSFVWTVQQTTRVLTRTEDLNYLTAFGNSIMAEVARLDVVDTDRVKSDFISSISHELRSPLHGILGSVEFLQDTTVNSFQHGMIDTIERCGRTLLDTIQHVLDFTKINTFTRSERSDRSKLGPSERRPGLEESDLSVDVDLSLLTEDVVDSVFAGYEFQKYSSIVVADEASSFLPEATRRSGTKGLNDAVLNQPGSIKEQLKVVMDIGWRPNWTFNTQSGALRRILMNLFGNALKYTSRGWVKISLQAQDIKSIPPKPDQSIVTITVSDSGRGISQEYLHSGLFTPFTQENPMNQGTGLGLSIVLQLVGSLGGTIDITSEQGVGTGVVVTLTLNQAPSADRPSLSREGGNVIQTARKKTTGLTVGLLGFDANPAIPENRPCDWKVESEATLFLQTSFSGMAKHWFDMEVSAPQTWKASPPNVYVTNEQPARRDAVGGVPTIVLCSYEAVHREYNRRVLRGGHRSNDALVHFVSEPCGPHKLAKALAFCVGNASHVPRPFSPGLPHGTLASPQSLFRDSPESSENAHRMDYVQDGYFPLTASRANEVLVPAVENAHTEKQKPVLLLVDDNKINLQLLCALVSKGCYEYDTAENGLEALQAFQNAQKPYDIVFMDISMPVMDGMEATREIRSLECDRRQKPAMIIALTGLGSATSQQEAFYSGVNLYLTKPVRFNDLRKILGDWTPDMEMEGRRI